MTPAPFTCPAPTVTDADTIRCGAVRIRIAGITALERDGSCNSAPDCAAMPYREARAVVQRIVYRQRLTCTPLGRSYRRIVAQCRFDDGRDLGCAIVASGAAVWWPAYRARYRLPPCP